MFGPLLIPETTMSGSRSNRPVMARWTQSVGVPSTLWKPLSWRVTYSGFLRLSELLAPLRSRGMIRYVLGVNAGMAEKTGIRPGSRIRHPLVTSGN